MLTALSSFVFLDVRVVTAVLAESILGPTHFDFLDFTLSPVLLQNLEGGKGLSRTSASAGHEDLEERSEWWVLRT